MGESDMRGRRYEIHKFQLTSQGHRTSMGKNILISLACSALLTPDTAIPISRKLW